MEKAKWAIRDLEHGKTFTFQSWDEMVLWLNEKNATFQAV